MARDGKREVSHKGHSHPDWPHGTGGVERGKGSFRWAGSSGLNGVLWVDKIRACKQVYKGTHEMDFGLDEE